MCNLPHALREMNHGDSTCVSVKEHIYVCYLNTFSLMLYLTLTDLRLEFEHLTISIGTIIINKYVPMHTFH